MPENERILLDGSSFETVLTSFSQLWNVTPERLISEIKNLDLYELRTSSEVIRGVKNSLNIESEAHFDGMLWFHNTRVPSDTSFEEGIIPTHLLLEKIWSFIEQQSKGILNADYLTSLRSFLEKHDTKYKNKMRSSGPFALNLRELAFRSDEVHNHDYFSTVEIFDDILHPLWDKENDKRIILLQRIKEATFPCIVTFVNSYVNKHHVACALFYIKLKIEEDVLSNICNICFDGNGQKVLPEFIISIEFVEYEPTLKKRIVHEDIDEEEGDTFTITGLDEFNVE